MQPPTPQQHLGASPLWQALLGGAAPGGNEALERLFDVCRQVCDGGLPFGPRDLRLPDAPGTCPAERALVLAGVVDWGCAAGACNRPWRQASADQLAGFFTRSFWLSAHFRL